MEKVMGQLESHLSEFFEPRLVFAVFDAVKKIALILWKE